MSGHIDDDIERKFHHCTGCGEDLSFLATRHRDALCPECWSNEIARRHGERRRDFGPLWGVVLTVTWIVIFLAAVLWLVGAI